MTEDRTPYEPDRKDACRHLAALRVVRDRYATQVPYPVRYELEAFLDTALADDCKEVMRETR